MVKKKVIQESDGLGKIKREIDRFGKIDNGEVAKKQCGQHQ